MTGPITNRIVDDPGRAEIRPERPDESLPPSTPHTGHPMTGRHRRSPTVPTPPYVPGGPGYVHPQAAFPGMPTPPRRRRWPVVTAGLFLVAALVACLAGVIAAADDPAATSRLGEQQPARTLTDPSRPAASDATTAPPAGRRDLRADDVTLSVRKTRNQCFGSAGCNVEARVTVTLAHIPDASDNYLVTFEVRGVEDGPITDSFQLTGDVYDVPEISTGTKSRNAKITAKVIDVEKLGL